MQRYSFAKFLELHFYPADVKLVQGAGCQHNIYQHHIRYFAAKGMTVRFQADSVALHEIVYPPKRIRVHPESQLRLKNSDFNRLHYRNVTWYSALVDDLKLISIDAATGDEEADARLISSINTLIIRAEAEREEITRLINQIYNDSSPTDTIALNRVRSYRQDKIVAWQQDFDRLPKPRQAVSVDNNGRKSSAFGSVRAIWPKNPFDGVHIPSSSVSEAEEGPANMRRVTGDSLTSSASDASEPETNEKNEKNMEEKNEETDFNIEALVTADPIADTFANPDPDSDSTIGAMRDDAVSPDDVPSTKLPVSIV
jgi:1-phosphatidylinositol-3-phosphate 5-kinase